MLSKKEKSMYSKMNVKYLLFNLKYPSYIKLQVFLVVAWLVGAILTFFLAQNSLVWFLKNGPWLYPIIAFLEICEAYIAVKKAKKEFDIDTNSSSA